LDDSVLAEAIAIANADASALVAVVGPTASGKTALAVRVAQAIDAEIVSCDSVQIYRGFDIGSGKPSADELSRARHHLIGALDPLEPIDAARYAELARETTRDIQSRGKRVIVCGGTFLWMKALLFGLADAPAADEAIRARHRETAEKQGRPALHATLRTIDPTSASRLHPNDLLRVSRALEVFELTGKPLSEWQREHAFATKKHAARMLGIAYAPEELTRRIEARVRAMLEAGLVDEVRTLVAHGYSEARAMGSVGYREVRMLLDGAIAEVDLAPSIVRATRVFARRQRTWLHHVDVAWLGRAADDDASRAQS
jgi:tRNA dimethylallyltransferase